MSTTSQTQLYKHRSHFSHSKLVIITGLLLLSTLLFIIGVARERGGFTTGAVADVHQETGESAASHAGEAALSAPEAHSESEESHEDEIAATSVPKEHSESQE